MIVKGKLPSSYFLELLGVSESRLVDIVGRGLCGAEDGELFLESSESESLSWKDERVDSSSYSDGQGFGLRRVNNTFVGYAHGNRLTTFDIKRAGRKLKLGSDTQHAYLGEKHTPTSSLYYRGDTPLLSSVGERSRFLACVDKYLRALPNVKNTSLSLSGSMQTVMIVRPDGNVSCDVRPLVRMNISVQCEKGKKREWGGTGFGGRTTYDPCMAEDVWQDAALSAYKEACDKLEAIPCPSGEMPVVLGPGWPGIILHEAIGHGLEGDAIRKGESVFATLLNERVASSEVSIVDDGTISRRRGSLNVDDEGTPTERTLLIDRGRLVSFMHDRMSARHYGVRSTGNARRESYECAPLVRMRNTMMLGGSDDPEEIVRGTQTGLYMPVFSGGQVDPVTGKFVFEAPVAYLIEGGRVTRPVVGATLIGDCVLALKHIDRVGADAALDRGIGTCGKQGQGVPVGVGQPTIRMTGGVVVGGTQTE